MPSSKERFKCKASIKNKQSKCDGNLNISEALPISSCSIESGLFKNCVCDEEYHKKWRADYSISSESNGRFFTNVTSKRSRLSGGEMQLSHTNIESSTQTLPYLPGISNDPQSILDMELFKLPTILPGDGPPGLYEVEVLERARKRWTFLKALKEKVRHQKQAIQQSGSIVMKSMESLSLIGTDFPAKNLQRTLSYANFAEDLKREEELLLEDPGKISLDRTIVNAINYRIPSDEIEDFKTTPIARAIPSTHDIQLYETFSDIPTHTYVEDIEARRVSEVEVELYRFLSIKADDNDIEEEEKSIEQDERIREEEYTEDEESQHDKTAVAEEHRESLHLDVRKATPPIETIEASFRLRSSSGLSRTSREPGSVYRESVTVKKPTLPTNDRPTLAEDIKKKRNQLQKLNLQQKSILKQSDLIN
uniref:Cilia- and flagella-associated protein 91 n=1 Tax=Glossina pallidipes TaxID=7398 RepID=A0A1B0AJN0_GLOPL